ncbi:ECF transporter S component [Mycoplasma marinum]|uniref:ECF transporter S component n=1 Tax=Mycoplasma marinum TaxID=1937190 RepID=A0A4R0XY80_9MOLU|nr:ECF transporter S component [Mycoplasma marinum]TCG12019.1 hypothetical protein C4B24_00195 [Mycoplasma marinum]
MNKETTKENVNEKSLTKDKKSFKDRIKDNFKITIHEIVLAGILIGLFIISGLFISIKLQGIMDIGITFVFLIMFGLIFGPIKGVFFALIADTITLALGTYGIGAWMWEYEIMTVGIPLMAWAFKYLFTIKQKYWWISMVAINSITIIGIFIVILISSNNPLLQTASRRNYNFDGNTQIMIYCMAGFLFLIELIMFIVYGFKKNDNLKLVISITTLVAMIIIIWIWIWGPIAYVRFLQRLANQGYSKYSIDHYTYEKYYKIALWARVLKTPIITPIYVAILIPLYKACEFTINKTNGNKY